MHPTDIVIPAGIKYPQDYLLDTYGTHEHPGGKCSLLPLSNGAWVYMPFDPELLQFYLDGLAGLEWRPPSTNIAEAFSCWKHGQYHLASLGEPRRLKPEYIYLCLILIIIGKLVHAVPWR